MDETRTEADNSAAGTGWSYPDDPSGAQQPRDPWSPGSTESAPDAARPIAPHAGDGESSMPPYDTAATPGPGAPAPAASADGDATTGKRRGTAVLVAVALGAGALGGVAGGVGGSAVYAALSDDEPAPAVSTSDVDELEPETSPAVSLASVEDVAAQLLPSVVKIEVGQGGSGSGVIISEDGQILTNNHVVANSPDEIQVLFHDGTSAPAEIVGTDPTTDLAVIQVDGVSDLQPAELGSSAELSVGEQVVAIGSPLGLDGTVTTGIVSALDRPVTAGGGPSSEPTRFSAIQTDASVNPGNSGGPLVNMAGQVVGINSAIATTPGAPGSIGLGFAIPIDQAKVVAEQLIETGTATHARLQIGVNDARGETAGALVAEVQPGGVAADAGLAEGDIITHLDERRITDSESLIAAVRSYRPGDEITLTAIRDGEEMTIEVTLGSSNPSI